MRRRDIHIHFGDVDIGSTIDPEWRLQDGAHKAELERIGRRVHSTRPATLNEMRERIKSESLAQVCLFCDNEYYLAEGMAALSDEAEVTPVYWARDWDNPNIPWFAKGIKIHPMIEGKIATVDNLQAVMYAAKIQEIPVLLHTEEENPACSRGRLIAELAEENPDVTIVALHAGAYGAPQFRGMSGYKETLVEFVSEAVEAAIAHPNVYLETSCLAFPEKAQLLYEGTQRHPELLDRIVMGSDFPILEKYARLRIYNTFDHQEVALRSAGFSDENIQRFYDNVRKAAPPFLSRDINVQFSRGYYCSGLDLF